MNSSSERSSVQTNKPRNSLGSRIRRLWQDSGLRQDDFAQQVGISVSTLLNYMRDDRRPDSDVLAQLAKTCHVRLDWLIFGTDPMQPKGSPSKGLFEVDGVGDQGTELSVPLDRPEVTVPDWTPPKLDEFHLVPLSEAELSAGGGAFVLSEEDGAPHAFRLEWLHKISTSPNNVILMPVTGDSMEPLLKDGDVVMIDRGRQKIRDGYIYALGIDETIMVKRLVLMPGGRTLVKSDNQFYQAYEASLADIRVLGQVIWFARELV